jgi:nickel/cobalt transporter (NicO) family protein
MKFCLCPRRLTAGMGAALGVMLIMSTGVRAHRLDEYLQAARLSLAPDRVALELDLTPGVAVAAEVIGLLDRNPDGTITPLEARAYGEVVLSDVVVSLDGRPLTLTLDRVAVPSSGELRDGTGTIQLRASAGVEGLAAGRHAVQFQNNHHPRGAAYLVNALKTDDRAIHVASQRRDPTQREARIEYDVEGRSLAQMWWLLVAIAALSMRRVGRSLTATVARVRATTM